MKVQGGKKTDKRERKMIAQGKNRDKKKKTEKSWPFPWEGFGGRPLAFEDREIGIDVESQPTEVVVPEQTTRILLQKTNQSSVNTVPALTNRKIHLID